MIMVGKKVGQERLEESLGYVGMDLRSGPLSTPAFRRSAAAGHDRSGAHDAAETARRRPGHVHA
jgi:hypothetical protein